MEHFNKFMNSTRFKKLLTCFILFASFSYFVNSTQQNDPTAQHTTPEQRRDFIRQMVVEAWDSYRQFAWGADAVDPVNQRPLTLDYGNSSGWTIVASMSTLWVLGLKDQFKEGQNWINSSLNLSQLDRELNVSILETDYLAGLLSCYALSGEKMFLNKAHQLAQALKPVYRENSQFGNNNISKYSQDGKINLFTQKASSSNLNLKTCQVSSQTVEYLYLIRVLTNQNRDSYCDRFRYFYKLSISNPKLQLNVLKSIIQLDLGQPKLNSLCPSNSFDLRSIMYPENTNSKGKSVKSNLTFFKKFPESTNMSYSDCAAGSLLALAADAFDPTAKSQAFSSKCDNKEIQNQGIQMVWELAEQITETCHQAMVRSKTGLAPRVFYFDDQDEATNLKEDSVESTKNFNFYTELSETYFTMYRLTRKEKYRDYAWEMVKSIYKHCRVTQNGGYSTLKDVNQESPVKLGVQQPDLLSGTLKYLYLTFTNESVLPLDKWLFTAVGHPIPIKVPNIA